MKTKYEIRQIDAWGNRKEGYWWNDSFHIAEYETSANDHKRAFLYKLHTLGIVCNQGECRIDYDGSIYELQQRKTGKPLFAAIPIVTL